MKLGYWIRRKFGSWEISIESNFDFNVLDAEMAYDPRPLLGPSSFQTRVNRPDEDLEDLVIFITHTTPVYSTVKKYSEKDCWP